MAVLQLVDSQYLATSGSSQTFATALLEGMQYMVVCSTASWIAIGTSPTAAKQTGGSTYLAPNVPYFFVCPPGTGANVNKLAIIQDSATGSATVTRCQ